MIENETGKKWLYIPEAHIQVHVFEDGDLIVIAAHRTDGYLRSTGRRVIDQLRETHCFTSEVEVPKWVVDFAVESERKRQETVDGITGMLQGAAEEGGEKPSARALLDLRAAMETNEEPDLERTVALEIQRILREAGGHH